MCERNSNWRSCLSLIEKPLVRTHIRLPLPTPVMDGSASLWLLVNVFDGLNPHHFSQFVQYIVRATQQSDTVLTSQWSCNEECDRGFLKVLFSATRWCSNYCRLRWCVAALSEVCTTNALYVSRYGNNRKGYYCSSKTMENINCYWFHTLLTILILDMLLPRTSFTNQEH